MAGVWWPRLVLGRQLEPIGKLFKCPPICLHRFLLILLTLQGHHEALQLRALHIISVGLPSTLYCGPGPNGVRITYVRYVTLLEPPASFVSK